MSHAGRVRGWTSAVAAVAATALLAGGCSSSHASPRSGPTTTAKGATATTDQGGTTGAFSWSLDADPHLGLGGGPGTTLAAVLAPSAGGPGWVIAGTRDNGSGSTTATVWTSPDGVAWTAKPLTGASVSSDAAAAASWRTSTVVVGSVGTGTERRAQVWVSQGPGGSYTAVPVTSTNDSPSAMDHVTAGNLGYFATGTISGQPAVWYSTNGSQWSVSTGATRFIDSFPGAQVNSILATYSYVFAAGSVRDGTSTDAALWRTQDGINWRQIVSSQGAFSGGGDHVITGLAPLGTLPSGGGLLAVGGLRTGGTWAPVSWISPDGASWSQPAGDFPRDPGDSVVRAVAPVATLVGPTEYFATGGGPSNQNLWQSADGVRWNQVALPAGAGGSDGWRSTLVASDGHTTVVADGDAGQAHVLTDGPKGWTEPSGNPGAFGPISSTADVVSLQQTKSGLELTVRVTQDPQAIGAPAVSTVTLASSDGVNWTQLGAGAAVSWPPGNLPAGSAAVVRAAPGWIAVGAGPAGTAAPQSGPDTSGIGLAWSSSDGTHWNAPVTLDAKPGIGPEQPRGACTSGTTVVAVGESEAVGGGAVASAWYTADGATWKAGDVTPSPGAGGAEEMFGCARTGSGFAAFGAATSTGGDSPLVWTSADGARWTRPDSSAFGGGTPGPLTALAVSGTSWLAVASAARDAEPDGFPGGWHAGPTAPEGAQLGVWISQDGGTTWQRLDSAGGVWDDAQGAVLEGAGFAAGRAVVAGRLDGRIVVWTGAAS